MNKKLLDFVAYVPISYTPRYAFSDLIYNFNNAFCKLGLRFTDFSKLDVFFIAYPLGISKIISYRNQ